MSNSKKKPAKKAVKKRAVAKKKPVPKKVIYYLMDVPKDIPAKDYLKILSINPEANSMHEALGISKERFIDLEIEVIRAIKMTERFSSAMEQVSQQCKHVNELAMCVYLLAEERFKPPPLIEFLAQMRGKGGRNPDE